MSDNHSTESTPETITLKDGASFSVLFSYREMNESEWGKFCESITKTEDIIQPIVVDDQSPTTGIIDGYHRLKRSAELGLSGQELAEAGKFDIRRGLSREEKERLARDLNEHRRHLTFEERRELAKQRARRVKEKRGQGKSYREIAKEEGISFEQARKDDNQPNKDSRECATTSSRARKNTEHEKKFFSRKEIKERFLSFLKGLGEGVDRELVMDIIQPLANRWKERRPIS